MIRWQGRILLCRQEKPGKEYWLLPGGGVDSGDSHVAAAGGDRRRRPPCRLAGSLFGDRDREDLPRPDLAPRHELGDAVGQHAGVARACSGDDQQRRPLMGDRDPLLGVEPLEKRFRVAADR